ncbi:ankyrin repeat domain-containing protein [Amycolatopsis sp. CA-230715]|uniref:ankyrin repeat domain-containing protein n=1 Tax=Amycolatopsis sp. CA-230715 TaxID=2745196 RepID=UPI001C01764F|nr:ankyrin repeat domain-containing protein [Amycolatopsis sp. CA-230715]QWF83524.1 hypothetical protein HUW46_06965 [Amycolatopsis sp. CA-230715]
MLDRAGRDELHYAAADNDVVTVKERLDAGVDVDLAERRSGFTPLHFAVQGGALDTTVALLDAGADIQAPTVPRGASPLHLAVSGWRLNPDGAMIDLLLARGADKTAREKNGWTPDDLAKGAFEFPAALAAKLHP